MNGGRPTVSIVIPVRDRPAFLRRALGSVAAQSFEDFECVVVDDCSTEPIETVVAEFDERFVCLRRDVNGGPATARLTGYAHAHGEIVVKLDSDDELFPHAVARAVETLAALPDVHAVIALSYLEGKLPLRVRGGERTVAPAEYARRRPPPFDVVDVFRGTVVREWVDTLPSFFKEEFAFKLTLGLRHGVVYIDEPWGRHHADAPNRVSKEFDDPRWLDDLRAFVTHFHPLLGSRPCVPLDQYLTHRHYLLRRRGHREEALLVQSWLSQRGVGVAAQARLLAATRFRDRRGYVV